jgi:redox-sensitive bicupin YhaK (pirin superfamily)
MTTVDMNRTSTFPTVTRSEDRQRRIVFRTRGHRQGPITRLMNPSDLGRELKPFVFLDLVDTDGVVISGRNLHPHSGIVTVTYLFQGSSRYEDTTGAGGILSVGGVEWFKAGHGAWHGGGAGESGRTRGYQLWIALSPDHELGSVESINQEPDDVASVGPVDVIIGAYGGAVSPLDPGFPLNYLAVRLNAGESWNYEPPADHTVAWMSVGKGSLFTSQRVEEGELVVFEDSQAAIAVHAETDTELVLGSASASPSDLALGSYSVHSSLAALEAGERRIREIGARLRAEGQL